MQLTNKEPYGKNYVILEGLYKVSVNKHKFNETSSLIDAWHIISSTCGGLPRV